MFIKIFCGDSQKYLLLQSNNVVLNKQKVNLLSELYPIVCRYIDEMSEPVGEQDMEMIEFLSKEYKDRRAKFLENFQQPVEDGTPTILDFTCKLCPNMPYELMAPVLSDEQEAQKLLYSIKNAQSNDEPHAECMYQISTVEIDDKVYFTTGAIFVMNDDGKTIDRV